jgi:hypothetical protein
MKKTFEIEWDWEGHRVNKFEIRQALANWFRDSHFSVRETEDVLMMVGDKIKKVGEK